MVVEARDAAAAVEVGADADVVDAGDLHRVVDVIDEVLERRAGELRVDLLHPLAGTTANILSRSACCSGVGGWAGWPPPGRPAAPRPRAQLLAQLRAIAAARSGESSFRYAAERHDLDDAAVLRQRLQLVVVEVAVALRERRAARSATR